MKQKILVVDIGGTNVKFKFSGQDEERRFPSGPTISAEQMTKSLLEQTKDWAFDAVSIGYPGPVVRGKILTDPRNLGPGWLGFDFEGRFGRPVKICNDAAMQALGSYDGGHMLFLGLGTGLGTAVVYEKVLVSLEIAHLPFRKGRSYEQYLGVRGLERMGKKRWTKMVHDVVELFKHAMVVDYVVLGGGNAKKLKDLPPDARLGDNKNAFLGGIRLWADNPFEVHHETAPKIAIAK